MHVYKHISSLTYPVLFRAETCDSIYSFSLQRQRKSIPRIPLLGSGSEKCSCPRVTVSPESSFAGFNSVVLAGHRQQALECFEKVLSQQPESFEALKVLGSMYSRWVCFVNCFKISIMWYFVQVRQWEEAWKGCWYGHRIFLCSMAYYCLNRSLPKQSCKEKPEGGSGMEFPTLHIFTLKQTGSFLWLFRLGLNLDGFCKRQIRRCDLARCISFAW